MEVDAEQTKWLLQDFLVRSITGGWKQPLGYALVNGACPRDEMETLMREAIDKLKGIGLTVVVVISDMGSNFQSLANHLNITPENPWFIHNNEKVFVMFDPPHLLKCVRNNLMKYSFKFDNYTATWKDIESFYNKDMTLAIQTAPKLTDTFVRMPSSEWLLQNESKICDTNLQPHCSSSNILIC